MVDHACQPVSADPVLVLDIDGVVSLAQPGSAHPWYADLQADWGFDHDEMARDFFQRDFRDVLRGRLDLYVALQTWLETKGMADRVEELVAYWFARDAVIDRDVLAQADGWRQRTGGRCFAATNQEHHRVAWLREHAGLDGHFDEIIYSAALGVCKPERVFFTNAQARMGVTVAQSILFVDDAAANVDGARAAGWRAMLYRGRESLHRALQNWG
jgi:putative hydrolase of the HAD superfamily